MSTLKHMTFVCVEIFLRGSVICWLVIYFWYSCKKLQQWRKRNLLSRDAAQECSTLQDDEHNGIDGSFSMKVDALESYPFEQMKR